ncbi:MAG TPA: enoyl-CoA hydratase-related protein [Gemmataceae bacterium]|nr:enoyl-CoA hydratase-related protein [Gemmataceae bacterium]
MSATYQTLLVAMAGNVCTVTLNRPDSLNALNETMTAELASLLQGLQQNPQVRCVVLTGAGRAFSSGQDLGDLKKMYTSSEQRLHLAEELRRRYNPVVWGLRDLEKPVVAAINGVAAGAGLSLALACDLRIASDKASFIEAFVNVGLVPDSASTFFLPRLVGLGKALEMCFTGEKVSAADALAFGLVNKVVPADELAKATQELAARLAQLPTRAIGLMKGLLYRSFGSDLDAQLEAEAQVQEVAGLTADHREGVLAFFEKRPPNFRGQ